MEYNELEELDQLEFESFYINDNEKDKTEMTWKEIDELNDKMFYNYDYESLKKFLREEEKKQNKFFKFWKNIFFFSLRYLITSSLIFTLLMLTTNYQAYINVINSYIKKDQMVEVSDSIINSVKASNITASETWSDDDNNKTTLNNSLDSFVNLKDENPSLNIDLTPYDNRVVIPTIWKNVPLIDIKNKTVSGQNELNDIFMNELENWVIRYPWSVKPGEIWNTFIFWHSSNFPWIKWDYNDVFALLDNVQINDDIIIYYNQKKYVYKIKKKDVISPGNVSILKENTTKSQVLLMTCWPIWTTLNRLILTWELEEAK